MEGRSALAAARASISAGTAGKKREHHRHLVSPLAYVRIDHANGGIVRDLSESGMAIQAVARLHPDDVVHLRFDLLRPRVKIEATGQVAWADNFGQAGLRFLDLPAKTQRQLKEWLLNTLLTSAHELSLGDAPIFKNREEGDAPDGLILSPPPVPAIHLAPPEPPPVRSVRAQLPLIEEAESPEMPIRLSWWPADISPSALANFVDGLIIVSAVPLFAIVFVVTTGVFPSWMVGVGMVAGVAAIFGWMYHYLFLMFSGVTFGRHLARLASEDLHWTRKLEEDLPRFR